MSMASDNPEALLWQSDTNEVVREHRCWYVIRYYGWVMLYLVWLFARVNAKDGNIWLQIIFFIVAIIIFTALAIDPVKPWFRGNRPYKLLKVTKSGFVLERRKGGSERYDWADSPRVSIGPTSRWLPWHNGPVSLELAKHVGQPSERNLRWYVARSRLAGLEAVLGDRLKESV